MSSEGNYNVQAPSRGLGKPDREQPVSDKIEHEVRDIPLSFPSRVFSSSEYWLGVLFSSLPQGWGTSGPDRQEVEHARNP